MFSCKAEAYPIEAPFKVPNSRVGSWSNFQTLYKAGKACKGQTLHLVTNIRKLQTVKVLYHRDQVEHSLLSLSHIQACSEKLFTTVIITGVR
jgi:hypothetical protein